MNWPNRRRYFELLIEEGSLLLQPDGARPFDKACGVPFGLGVLSSAEVLRPFLIGLTMFLASCFFMMEGQWPSSSPWPFLLWTFSSATVESISYS